MANKLLNFRCPEPLLEAIDKIGRSYYPSDNESGCDRSKTLIDILKAGVEAINNGEVVLPLSGTVRQDVRQVTEADIRAMVEAVLEEKLAPLTVQVPPNIPTRDEFHDLKDLVNGFKLGLMREIQNRDVSINLLAKLIAELTARLDNDVVTREVLDQFIDIIENPSKTEAPITVEDTAPNKSHMRLKAEDDRIPKSIGRDWEDVCTDSIDDLRAQWYGS